MKWAKRVVLAAAIIGAAATAASAQLGGNAGMEFVEAVRAGNAEKALQLLKSNPTAINARSSKGETALHAAVARRESDWTAFLLQEGADPDLGDRSGDTPLIAAARIGFADAVDYLLQSKAKVNATNRMGETALIIAVQNRHLAIIRTLLAAGADPDKTDSAAGLSARDYAKRDTRTRDILRLIEAKKPQPAL